LTYVYADQTAVLGPLATYAEPHAYDLCDAHSERLSAPRGWEVLRLAPDPAAQGPTSDDLLALADAVREAARPTVAAIPGPAAETGREVARRGHLRVLTSD
jgi:enoyl-CoA hydratase/carnithine racemase